MDNNFNVMLTEGWTEGKSMLLEGVPAHKRKYMSVMLESARNHLLETASAGSVQASDIANFRKAVLPMIRRVIPGTFASELVGVQPLTGPVGQVFTLRWRYDEPVTHTSGNSVFGGFDIAAGDEAFSNAKPIRQFYSGNTGAAQGAGRSGFGTLANPEPNIDQATAVGDGWGATQNSTTYTTGTQNYGPYSVPIGGTLLGGSGSFLEGSGGRKMRLDIVSQAVEAKSRKLQASWTPEAAQDLKNQHDLNIESELLNGLTAEIAQEMDAEVINDLLGIAGTIRTYDYDQTDGPNYAPAWVGDRFANLGVKIMEVANEIARKTRRNPGGNFVVASPMITTVLQTAKHAVFAPFVQGNFEVPFNNQMIGTLNGRLKVYNYLWNQASSVDSGLPGAGTDKILVGYKGGNNETDAGYFWCPYIPITSSGQVINPVTYQSSMSIMTRYAKVVFSDPTLSLGNSSDYYGRINVSNLNFI